MRGAISHHRLFCTQRFHRQVNIFGIKSEGQYAVGWFRDSSNITLFGYGGNACPFDYTTSYPPGFHQATPSLFRLTNTHNTRIVNLVDFTTGGTLQSVMGVVGCVHVDRRVLVVAEGEVPMESQLMDRPLLVHFD